MTVRTWPGLAIRIAGIAALGTIQVGWLLQPVPLALKLFQIVLLAVSCVRPEAGLSILAGLGLLSTAISGLADSPWAGGKLLEQMVLAVVTGALVRFQPIQGRTRLGAPMAFYAIVAAASAAALVPARVAAAMPGAAPLQVLGVLWRTDFFDRNPLWSPVYLGMLAIESALLAWTVERAIRRLPALADRLLQMFLIGAAALSSLSVYFVLRTALRSGAFAHRLPGLFLTLRVNMQTDVNAGASLFLLILLASASLVRGSRLNVIVHASLMGLIAIGLWNTGSRIALLSLMVTLTAIGVVLVFRASRRVRLVVAAVLVAGAIAGAFAIRHYPAGRNPAMNDTVRTRLALSKAALQMAKGAPAFGVGIGRYYELSGEFAPQVFREMNTGTTRENAHNNFLQVLAEEGVAGLVALLLALGAALAPAIRAEMGVSDRRRRWLIVGVCACLLTWISGHPLLVGEFAFVFWMYAAMLAGITLAPAGAPVRWLAAIAAVVVACSAPARAVQQLRTAPLDHIGAGLSQWQHDREIPYRRAGRRFSIYLRAGGSYVTLPIERAAGAPDPLKLEIWIDGRLAGAELIGGSDWQTLRFLMPHSKRDFVLVDFVAAMPPGGAEPADDLLRVGKAQWQ